jgi:hypothetical protein
METTKLLTALFTENLLYSQEVNRVYLSFTVSINSYSSEWVCSKVLSNLEFTKLLNFQSGITFPAIHWNDDEGFAWSEISPFNFSLESNFIATEVIPANADDFFINYKYAKPTFDSFRTDDIICEDSPSEEYISVEMVVQNSIQPPVVYLYLCYQHPSSFVLNATESVMNNIIYWCNYSDSIVGISNTLVKAMFDSFTCFYIAEYELVTNFTGRQSNFGVLFSTPHQLPILANILNCGVASSTRFHNYDAHISDYRWCK